MARTGDVVSYRDLAERSRRCARLMRDLGARHGTSIAILMENHHRYLEIAWAAQRSGLRYTGISNRLTADEVAYILRDSSPRLSSPARPRPTSRAPRRLARPRWPRGSRVDPGVAGFEPYDDLIASVPATPLDDEREGADFLYSSGTTGRPKAISPACRSTRSVRRRRSWRSSGPCTASATDTVYLSPAPLYHSAPLRFTHGRPAPRRDDVVMERFDAGERAGADRAPPGHPHADGPDDVRPPAPPARRGARALRPVVAARRRPRGGAVPAPRSRRR